MEYLDFEKPIEELMTQLNKAKELGGEGVDVSQAISDLELKLKDTRKTIYSNLTLGKRYSYLVILIAHIH